MSLPDLFRQSMNTLGTLFACSAVMDARNKCGHDTVV